MLACPLTSVWALRGMLKKTLLLSSCMMVTRNLAFSWGSSKQGKALLAYVGSKCVVASLLKQKVSPDSSLEDYSYLSVPSLSL